MSAELVAVAVPAPLHQHFDYELPSGVQLRVGMRVRVPFGRRSLIGVVVQPPRVEEGLRRGYKAIEAVLDEQPLLPAELLGFLRWCSAYYQHPIGEVIAAALPGPLRRGAWPRAAKPKKSAPLAAMPELTAAQARALAQLRAAGAGFSVSLLEGVTGSGKTELYLRRIADVLAQGQQALLLVPEIGLTPQLTARLQERFGACVVSFHSGLSESARAHSWLAAREGCAQIVCGTRSAALLPFHKLGLVVVDEEHDASYKQQEGFRYSARDALVWRAQKLKVPVILGSATPALESLHNAREGRYQLVELKERVSQQAPPRVQLLDMRGQVLSHGLSAPLVAAARRQLADGGQCLFFLNRRGYAPLLLCHDCGWIAPCVNCDARLTVHRARGRLICHHCGAQQAAPRQCPSCDSAQLVAVGQGTERIEDALRNLFPGERVERLDADRLRKAGELESLLADIRTRRIRLLVGTQVLAKGHDFSGLTMVGIVDADQALYGSDFRAIERMGQLITQVAGRAGRAGQGGEVLLQTHEPDHPLLKTLVQGGYRPLCEALLEERRITTLPPFSHLALLRAESQEAGAPLRFLSEAQALLSGDEQVQVAEPIPAVMERRAGYTRAQLLFQSPSRARLQKLLAAQLPLIEALPQARKLRWSVDVDPYDLF